MEIAQIQTDVYSTKVRVFKKKSNHNFIELMASQKNNYYCDLNIKISELSFLFGQIKSSPYGAIMCIYSYTFGPLQFLQHLVFEFLLVIKENICFLFT